MIQIQQISLHVSEQVSPGKAASSTVFFNTPKQEPGAFGKKLGQQVDTEKLICNEKEALQARLQEIRDKELEKIINVKGEDIR